MPLEPHALFGFKSYQEKATRTMGDGGLAMTALGLAGETGEVVEMVKKHLYHGKPLDREKFTKELGDVLWYLSACCEVAGVDFAEVARANIEKLEKRYPNGFNHQDSERRVDLDVKA